MVLYRILVNGDFINRRNLHPQLYCSHRKFSSLAYRYRTVVKSCKKPHSTSKYDPCKSLILAHKVHKMDCFVTKLVLPDNLWICTVIENMLHSMTRLRLYTIFFKMLVTFENPWYSFEVIPIVFDFHSLYSLVV